MQFTVAIRAWIRVGEAFPLNLAYAGTVTAGVNWAATGEGYSECVARTVQETARKIAADAARILKAPAPPAPAAQAAAL